MGLLRTGVAKKGTVILLASVAGMGLAAAAGAATQGSHNGSRSSSSAPHHHFSHPGNQHFNHFSRPPARIVVAPRVVVAPRRYYYVPGPFFYPPPVYAPPPVAYAQPVYPSLNSPYAYFCPDYNVYYPQVMECPSGWVQVAQSGAPGY